MINPVLRGVVAVLLVCSAGIAVTAAERGVPPVPSVPLSQVAGPQAKLNRQWGEQVLAWNLAFFHTAYATAGTHDPAWDPAAEQLLGLWAARFGGRPPPSDIPGELRLARKLCDTLHCPDPLVRYCAGRSFQMGGDAARGKELLSGSAAALEASRYPRTLVASAVQQDILALDPVRGRELAVPLIHHFVGLMSESLVAGEYRDHERLLAERLVESEVGKRFDAAYAGELVAGFTPLGDRWVAQHLCGWAHIHLAWAARGGGWATEVIPADWQGFRDHLAQARTTLTAAWTAAPDQPLSASQMITVAMAAGDKRECRMWFDRAVAAEFDHPGAYHGYFYALWPRWLGSYDEMLAFGDECAATGRHDTRVPMQLTETIRQIAREAHQNQQADLDTALFGDQTLWTAVDQVCQKTFATQDADTPRSQTDYDHSLHAILAVRFGHRAEAIAEHDQLGPRFRTELMEDCGVVATDFTAPVEAKAAGQAGATPAVAAPEFLP